MSTFALVAPVQIPAGTMRARSIRDIYTMALNRPTVDFQYQVGEKSTQMYELLVRNNTIAHNIMVSITVPSYITLSATSGMIAAGQTVRYRFTLNEADVDQRVIGRQFQVSDVVRCSCTVVNVTGPVYVLTTLPSLM